MNLPKILSLKAYYGHGVEPMCYAYDHEPICFILKDKKWEPKPSFLQEHFLSKELMPDDMNRIILNDLVDDADFELLTGVGMINEDHAAVYQKLRDMKNEISNLRTPPPPAPGPTPVDHQAILAAIQRLMSNSSVVAQIMSGAMGLSEDEKKILLMMKKG